MAEEHIDRQLYQAVNSDAAKRVILFPKTDRPDQTPARKISRQSLQRILDAHKKWLASDGRKGQRAGLRKADLRGADLRNVDLQSANLAGANLQNANLQGSDLAGSNLSQADLRGAILRESNLEGANLQEVCLKGTDLRKVGLGGANLRKADLRAANLEYAALILASLQNANLQKAILRQADMRFSDLVGADLGMADIFSADFSEADLRGVSGLTISQLSHVKSFYKAKLDEKISLQLRRYYPQLLKLLPDSHPPPVLTDDEDEKSSQQSSPAQNNLRKDPRKSCSKAVVIRCQNQWSKGTIKNISRFGAFIETTGQFSRGQMVELIVQETKIDKRVILKGQVTRLALTGIGVIFKGLLRRKKTMRDMGGTRSGIERRKLFFSEYQPEKRSGEDRRAGMNRRRLKYEAYYRDNPNADRIIDNGGRRLNAERRRLSFAFHWPEKRNGKDRRSGKDRRAAKIEKSSARRTLPQELADEIS
jgi:uncharacterized protein YjbI with pentapeptide repeats